MPLGPRIIQLGLGLNNLTIPSFHPDQDFDWIYSVYGDVHEILPDDMPEPLGEAIEFESLFSYWKILNWMPPFCQQNSCWLVFKETSHSGDSYLWFRV